MNKMRYLPLIALLATALPASAPGAEATPAWMEGQRPTAQAVQVISVLQHAGTKGLDPEDYDASLWDARLRGLNSGNASEFSAFLRRAVSRYAADIEFGRIAEMTPERTSQIAEIVALVVAASDPGAVLESLEPPFPAYRRMLAALAEYRRLAALDDGEQLPMPAKSVRVGDEWPGFGRVERLLRLTGDFTAGRTLRDAIARFQSRHGLEPDGVIGKSTVNAMNAPLAARVRQLELTLERWREAPRKFASPPIVVNIPEFGLHALDDSYRTAVAMKVVVGKALGHRTPVFSAEMRYVIFNPWWEIPPDIAKRELAPQLARSPGVLRGEGYQIVSNDGTVIARDNPSPNAIAGLRSGLYRARQAPGPKNALGEIKFIFPNAHNVYLHGTPATQLFAKTRRDFSHGCIRVERPEDLAAWVLRDSPEWTRDKIRDAMQSGRTLQVNLRHPIPVLIVYGTALAADSGEVHFFDDIYGLDAALAEKLSNIRKERRTNGI